MGNITQNLSSSLTGNLPKAILYVRDIRGVGNDWETEGKAADQLRTAALSALNKGAAQTLKSLSSMTSVNVEDKTVQLGKKGMAEYAGFLGVEVQYNPNSISMESVASEQSQYSGGALGNVSNNQITQIYQPVSTTMKFQLVFDDMNPSDAFMINGLALTGDLVTKFSNLVKKTRGESYSVKKQMEGLLSLLVSDATRQVIFFWAQMCFRGEVTNVNSRYTMFNPSGNPIRGVVDLTIRQGSGTKENSYDYSYEDKYWDKAFDAVFPIS